MLGKQEVTVEFAGVSENESFARMVVAAFAARLDPTMEELADVKTAVSEAVTNAILHGYASTEGVVRIRCRIQGDDELVIEIEDDGEGIADIKQAMEPMYTSKPELERSGMGFAFMEAFTDRLEVESELGKGTKITMHKKFLHT